MIPNISGILKKQNNGNPPSQEQIQKQLQMITQRFNAASSCGPSCQKDGQAEKLKKIYLDAKDNVEFGEEKYNDAEKNYFLFVNGENWWKDYKTQKINKSTKDELRSKNRKFMKQYESVKKGVMYYKSQFENFFLLPYIAF